MTTIHHTMTFPIPGGFFFDCRAFIAVYGRSAFSALASHYHNRPTGFPARMDHSHDISVWDGETERTWLKCGVFCISLRWRWHGLTWRDYIRERERRDKWVPKLWSKS